MKRFFLSLISFTLILNILMANALFASPMTQSDLNALNNYNDWVAAQCNTSDSANTPVVAGSGAAGGFTIDQVKTFSSEPISSTWNLSNSTVEQWFLKQAGAKATINKFGLNSSNIGQITSAVQAANVSPAFFFLYTVVAPVALSTTTVVILQAAVQVMRLGTPSILLLNPKTKARALPLVEASRVICRPLKRSKS